LSWQHWLVGVCVGWRDHRNQFLGFLVPGTEI
jgi:hypothetical protein